MILAFRYRGEIRTLRDSEAVFRSLDDVIEQRQPGQDHARATWLFLANEGDQAPVSCLEVSLNLQNGFGGVVWFAGGREAKRIEEETGSDIGYYFWVSDSGRQVSFDPEVLSDPHAPSYFDPRGVLPVAEIRKVIEEYCRSAGDRPSVIRWVAGNQNGTRLE
ncbi:Imm1 family immunity protein [Streptomyces roseolus]|uniref:Imm1 family immunity protein n=1 Tax=Streptomyces roseolus TaxID=67358 RepID=UPI0037BAD187